MKQSDGVFTRHLEFTTAFDKRNPDPKKNYGIHGVQMRFVLAGPEGAVQFLLFTNWQLPHVRAEWKDRGCDRYCLNAPMPADLGYHSKIPRYESQAPIRSQPCEWTGGGPCYYDGSGLNAEPVFDLLTSGGEEAVWKHLHEYYEETFHATEPAA